MCIRDSPNGDYTVDTHPGIHTGHGVRDDVRINLGDGNNTLRLACNVPDDLRILYGDGDVKVYIGRVGEYDSVTIGDDLKIRLGRGDHLVAVADGNNDADGDVHIGDRFKLDAKKSYHSKVNENKIHIGLEDRVARIGRTPAPAGHRHRSPVSRCVGQPGRRIAEPGKTGRGFPGCQGCG